MSTSSLDNTSVEEDVYIFPASFFQESLWFLDQLEPNRAVYNIPAFFRLTGLLNLRVLEQAMNAIVQRHETLRTTFRMLEGQLMQVISPTRFIPLQVVDLRNLSGPEQEAEVLRLAKEDAQRPFDLTRGPLLRTTLLQLEAEEHMLLLTMHHIISDGWSIDVLCQELAALYEAFLHDQPSPLPQLPIQYADFAVWQRQWLQGEVLATQLSYWRQQLTRAPALLDLPTDHPRPSVQTFRGAQHSFVLSEELADALKALSRREGITLFMTLLAAFNVLLYRYTGQTDIVVGSPIANRNRSGMEGLIGFFVNTLVLRTDLTGNPPFEQILRRVHKIALEAYAHQDLPFEELVKELHPERNMSYNPLFQVMFTFQTDPTPIFDLPGLHLHFVEGENETAKFDLSLTLKNTGQGLIGSLEYNTDLFEAATISRMGGHFLTLLEGIVANPGKPLSDLPLLTEAERHQLIIEWNAKETAYPKQVCIHQLFEEQVERTPEAVAVVFSGEQLTYQELNRKANQLAHHLQNLGVEPEVGVGICVERSLEMVMGLLGILKAGGAYIPLDPVYPKEQLAFMLEDSQVPVLLTQQRLLKDLPEYEGQVVCLDTDWEMIAQASEAKLICEVQPANLAYVIYTSGSTGRPKGVLGTHRAAINRFNWMWERFPFEIEEICCQKTSLSFVDSIWEIFGPLLQGIRTVLIPDEVLKDLPGLLHTLTVQRVTRIVLVPSLLRILLNTDNDLQHQLSKLKYWTSSGEALSLELLQRFQERMPQSRLINLYGSSEVAADATCYDLKNWKAQACVPIGRPIANTQVYLLDAFLQPVPIGVPGELYIGGDGVARGYLNRSELTAERFIPDPFSHQLGARLYKTGDLARYLPDGTIEFLGRLDHQVKIRGFRIELGEIEEVLSQHSEVQEAVVVAWEDTPEDKRLIAYIVAKPGQAPAITALRSLLKEQLPEYMVPSAFVLLEALPLTPNGKVDRRALPLPDQTRPELLQAYAVPRTPIEEMLAGMWSQLLGVDQVGIHDSFFDLGGHSLLATQLMSRVRDTFRVELPLRTLFETTTVAGLAEHVELAHRTKQNIQVPLLQAMPRVGTIPLSFAEERLWFFDQLEPGSPVYNIPVALHLKGPLNVTALHQSLNTIVQRHETLRTTFVAMDGKPLRIIAPTLSLALPIVDLSMLPEPERKAKTSQLAIEEAQQSFDLAQGPLVHTTLLELNEAEHVLLLTVHHITSDGWSIGVFAQEMAALYNAYSSEHPSPLPQLPIQYGDYALWQRASLQGVVREEQVSYWQQQLVDVPILQLPTDRPHPAVQTFCGAKYPLALSTVLTRELKEFSRREGVTLFMTLLAAFKVLLYRYTGQDDLCIGTPIANRTHSELEKLIGLLVNTVVLHTNLSGNPSFRELLERVREVVWEAYVHQEIPFEQVVEAIRPKRDLGYTPLFQVMFALQNFPMEDIEFADLTVNLLEVDNETAKFDVTLNLSETSEGLSGYFEYNTDLFEQATIARMTGHLQTLLRTIVAHPEQRLSELALLTEAERQQLLVERNATQTAFPKQVCIHQLFEEQIERTPDKTAVIFENTQLTYAELNRLANQLAHRLQKLGVGPEILVGICVDRSLEMIIGLLGILKAGGAYLPLDPTYPQARLEYMLRDADVAVLLSQQHIVNRLPPHKAQSVLLDMTQQEISEIAGESKENCVSLVSDTNLAYVIYTSGSSGHPKGTDIIHVAVKNFLSSMREQLHISSSDRLLAITSYSFDIALLELFLPLVVGASVRIASSITAADGSLLSELLTHSQITMMQATPTTWKQILAAGWNGNKNLKILCGGEALTAELAISLQKRGSCVWNLYGPTETTIWSTISRILPTSSTVSIGHPISNTQIYLLDNHLNPVPIGVIGEIYIGGVGLARGYHNRPDLTAERFIPHPLSMDTGARLYRTGDLARYLSDGNLEYLGRVDQQVKVRGFRIELGEIETLLNQHPAVQSSIVLPQEDIPGDSRLVAYLTVKRHPAPSLSDLRSYLREKLPDYMVPSVFMIIDALPLTLNRKVDRRALPKVEGLRAELETAFLAPQTEIERTLAAIWQEILCVKKVGMQDNFFDLGGSSLLLGQVRNKLQIMLKRNIALIELFEYPTVSSLVEHLNQEQSTLSSPERNMGRTEVGRESMRRQQQIRQRRRTMSDEQEGQAE